MNTMTTIARRAVALALLASLSSCMTMSEWDVKTVSGDFSGIVSDFDAQGGYEGLIAQGAEDPIPFTQVCNAFFELRDRVRYDECVEQLFPRIPEEFGLWFNDHDQKAFLIAQQAELRLEIDDVRGALELALRAERELNAGKSPMLDGPPHSGMVIRVLRVLGLAHAFIGDDGAARAAAERISDATFANTKSAKAWAFKDDGFIEAEFNLQRDARGTIYMALHDYEEAARVLTEEWVPEASFMRAIEKVSTAFDNLVTLGLMNVVEEKIEEHFADYTNYTDLPQMFRRAKVLFELGRYEEAQPIYDQLLTASVTSDFSGIYYVILHDRGRIAESEGQVDEAIGFYKRAIDEIERQRANVTSEAAKIGFVGDKQAVYRHLVHALIDSDRAAEAFEYAERGKARALVDLLASKQSFGDEGSSRRSEAERAVVQLAKADAEHARPLTKREFELRQSGQRGVDITDREVRVADRQLASLITVDSVAFREIAGRLAPDESLLEFFGEGEDLIAFVVAQGGIAAKRLDGTELDRLISAYRRSLQNPNDQGYLDLAERLHGRLIAPVAELIRGDTLTIVPHGALHYLPFSSLTEDGEPLVTRFAVRVLPSASVLTFLEVDRRSRGRLLALGNPQLGDPRFDLPYAEVEAATLARIERDATLLLRRDATETAVKRHGSAYARLHFASHGVFDPRKPLSSHLLLAPDGENDGNLTVSELYEMELDADLVTLSACETALGEIANGDDVVGFTRGFLFAGARAIVSSLWQVDDQATSDLMQVFYVGLREGLAPHDALRLAQMDLRAQGKLHPYYWAPFQLTGAI